MKYDVSMVDEQKERDDIHEKTKNIICECVIYTKTYIIIEYTKT